MIIMIVVKLRVTEPHFTQNKFQKFFFCKSCEKLYFVIFFKKGSRAVGGKGSSIPGTYFRLDQVKVPRAPRGAKLYHKSGPGS